MDIKINSHITSRAKIQQSLINKMTNSLQIAITNGETVTSEQLAKRIGASKDAVRHVIYKADIPAIKQLFDQVKSLKGVKKNIDKTLVSYSAAMTAAALAGISTDVRKANTYVEPDYTLYLAQKIEDLRLNDEVKNSIIMYLKKSPLFVDFLINNKDENGNRRRFGSNVEKMYQAYTKNTELTERLATAFDDDGNFMYSTKQIWKLVNIHENCPDLYEITEEQPDAIYTLYNLKDEKGKPRFGIEDIKLLSEEIKKFPKYTSYLLEEKDISNKPRFNTEQILFILNELQGDTPEFILHLVGFQGNIYKNSAGYSTNSTQKMKLSGDDIIKIIKMDKKYDVQDFVYQLMDVVEEDNITGADFVKYTELSTKSNVEFVTILMSDTNLGGINKCKLFESTGRKLTNEEFKGIEKNFKKRYFLWELEQFEQYVEK